MSERRSRHKCELALASPSSRRLERLWVPSEMSSHRLSLYVNSPRQQEPGTQGSVKGSSTVERVSLLQKHPSLESEYHLETVLSPFAGRELLQSCGVWSGMGDGCAQKRVHHAHCVNCIYHTSQAPLARQGARKPGKPCFCHVCRLPDEDLRRLAQSCACCRRENQNRVITCPPCPLPPALSFLLRRILQESHRKL